MVWGDGGVKAVGMEMGPMSVDRVVSAQVGSSGSERRDRAFLPMSMDEDGEGRCDSNDMLWVGGGGCGGDGDCMHGEEVEQ